MGVALAQAEDADKARAIAAEAADKVRIVYSEGDNVRLCPFAVFRARCVKSDAGRALQLFVVASYFAQNRFPLLRTML